jgi:hypothetical protein
LAPSLTFPRTKDLADFEGELPSLFYILDGILALVTNDYLGHSEALLIRGNKDPNSTLELRDYQVATSGDQRLAVCNFAYRAETLFLSGERLGRDALA